MPSEKAEVTSHTGSGDFNRSHIQRSGTPCKSLPTREVGISTRWTLLGSGPAVSLPTREVGISTVPPFAPPA